MSWTEDNAASALRCPESRWRLVRASARASTNGDRRCAKRESVSHHGVVPAAREGRPVPARGIGALCLALSLALSPLLLLAPGAASSNLNCHRTCICASNIVSCSRVNLTAAPGALPAYTAVLDLSYNAITRLRAEWTPVQLPKLHNLLLSHNGMSFLSSEAFLFVTRLRYLDLSSNALRQLDELIFEPLGQLEVLLLYGNRISQIDRTAFTGLRSLQKLYLSQNQVSRFPLELVKERTRSEKLSLLDLSSNRIKALPLAELQALPAWIRNGLYLHANPLACDCALYGMLARWHVRRLNSAVDFRDEFTCVPPGAHKGAGGAAVLGVFRLDGAPMNCSAYAEEEQDAYLDQTLVLACDARHRGARKTWATPDNVPLGPVRPEDSGVYTCVAASDGGLNETLYITVRVHNFTLSPGGDAMNTAYTTLVGCLASVVLVLIYLYLTPCRCFCCRGLRRTASRHDDSIHSSVLSATPTHGNGNGNGTGRHVAFGAPKQQQQGQNGKANATGREDEEEEEGEEEEEREALRGGRGGGGRRRRRSDADSISSVFSDTPIVV
ncbi:hypothetical protein AAFF_G00276740 [Aldrovandia affinis]|uniref:Ig-like domain-containing protein n=1 Tax=Aldrovandia affinis TaxID=143900 RepID=A0AAD7RAB0_9TELE|nr:hypothetical protein AAFF_G00276740 [Aldrovandia affinis]